MKAPRLNFGIHKGKLLSKVPQSYLNWLLTKDFCPSEVKEYIREKRAVPLTLTEEDKAIARGPRHPFYYGLQTPEAREELIKQNIINE